jgi:hypothetical protein
MYAVFPYSALQFSHLLFAVSMTFISSFVTGYIRE